MDLLRITNILSHITPWMLLLSIITLLIFGLIDIFKKKLYWTRFALIFLAVTIFSIIIQITLTYQLTKSIINLPVQTFTSTETADWKTYTSSDGVFSFKYPPEFTVFTPSKYSNVWFIMNDKPIQGAEGIITPGTILTISYFVTTNTPHEHIQKSTSFSKIITTNITSLGGMAAEKYQMEVENLGDPQTGISPYIIGTKYTKLLLKIKDYLLSVEYVDDKNPDIYNQILSTFKLN